MSTHFKQQQRKMLFLTMMGYLFFYTGRHNFGWASSGMAAEFEVSYETIGWVSFLMLLGYGMGQFVNGNLSDYLSARVMIPLGAYLSVSANVAISFSDSLDLVMVLAVVNGFSQSMGWAPGGKIISNWWGSSQRGRAFGLYTMAAGLSSVLTYLLSIVILQQNQNWRMLFRLPVLFLLVSATIFFLFIRDKPSEMGFRNPGDKAIQETEKVAIIPWYSRYARVIKNRKFLIVTLAYAGENVARYGFIFWVPVHYLGGSWKENPANLWVTFLLPIGMAAGAFCFGNLSDGLFRGNRITCIRIGMLCSAAVALIIYFSPPGNVLLHSTIMLLAGFFVYGPQTNFWTLCPEMLGNQMTGTGIGLMNMTGYMFAALAEPMFGKLIDLSGNTGHIFPVIALICTLSALAISTVEMPVRIRLLVKNAGQRSTEQKVHSSL